MEKCGKAPWRRVLVNSNEGCNGPRWEETEDAPGVEAEEMAVTHTKPPEARLALCTGTDGS